MSRKKSGRLVQVAVIAALRHPLTYRVPEDLDVRTGHRVQVPLGARRATGVVLEPVTSLAPGIKVRDIVKVLDPEPVLTPELLTLGLWIAEYYLAPIGEVFRAMLPLRSATRREKLVQLTKSGRERLAALQSDLLEETRRSSETMILRYLAMSAGVPVESVKRKFGAEVLQHAESQRWISYAEIERQRGERKIFGVRLVGPGADNGVPPVHGPVPAHPLKLAPAARRILEALESGGPAADHRELLKQSKASLRHLEQLHQSGAITVSRGEGSRPEQDVLPTEASFAGRELSTEQAAAINQISASLERGEFAVTLVQGVTGSGKTEVYLQLITQTLARERTVLTLVPEIALTPAVELQFRGRFGARAAVLHSGLTEKERHDAWWKIRRGEAQVVLGTRSAVFAPLDNLGLIIVDEEHESSYKQEETPRYHGRDVAVVRARLARATVVLGSATPSLESFWNARQQKYQLSTLRQRVLNRPLAAVEIVDMRQEFRMTHSNVPVSRRLHEEIEAQLAAGAQTMILLNRRGHSWFLLCRNCGQSVRCINCSVSLTYHKREHRLMCHYCGYSTNVPSRCRECASEYLHYAGEGTEKIEAKLAELFPGARVARLDRDVARRRGQFQKILGDFRQGKIDVLVGTQMIAKGHDFPGVTLVGVVSADLGLGAPDFRAAERTFQLLTQAAGRAGRGETPGRVLVQTFFPEHYAIRLAAEQNYDGFFAKEMSFRRLMHYPPSTALANIIAQHKSLEEAARVARELDHFLQNWPGATHDLRIMGPAPAPLARLKGRYRIQFLVKAASRARLHSVLSGLLNHGDEQGITPAAVTIDVDPVSVM
jgi:primosomal protein N' (replication factor Y)